MGLDSGLIMIEPFVLIWIAVIVILLLLLLVLIEIQRSEKRRENEEMFGTQVLKGKITFRFNRKGNAYNRKISPPVYFFE